MSLSITCDFCLKELDKPGALLFSPPYGEMGVVDKDHMCKRCFLLLTEIRNKGLFKKGKGKGRQG